MIAVRSVTFENRRHYPEIKSFFIYYFTYIFWSRIKNLFDFDNPIVLQNELNAAYCELKTRCRKFYNIYNIISLLLGS